MKFSKHQQRKAKKLNTRFPDHLVPAPLPPISVVPEHLRSDAIPLQGWRSSRFICMLWVEPSGARRLTVHSAEIDARTGENKDGITWDDLQQLKSEAGFGDVCAVEIYPPDDQLVYDHNMRHLWLLDAAPSFMWKPASE